MKCQFKLVGHLPFLGVSVIILSLFPCPLLSSGIVKVPPSFFLIQTTNILRKRLGVLWNNTQIDTTTQSHDDLLLIMSFCCCHRYVYSAMLDITIQW